MVRKVSSGVHGSMWLVIAICNIVIFGGIATAVIETHDNGLSLYAVYLWICMLWLGARACEEGVLADRVIRAKRAGLAIVVAQKRREKNDEFIDKLMNLVVSIEDEIDEEQSEEPKFRNASRLADLERVKSAATALVDALEDDISPERCRLLAVELHAALETMTTSARTAYELQRVKTIDSLRRMNELLSRHQRT